MEQRASMNLRGWLDARRDGQCFHREALTRSDEATRRATVSPIRDFGYRRSADPIERVAAIPVNSRRAEAPASRAGLRWLRGLQRDEGRWWGILPGRRRGGPSRCSRALPSWEYRLETSFAPARDRHQLLLPVVEDGGIPAASSRGQEGHARRRLSDSTAFATTTASTDPARRTGRRAALPSRASCRRHTRPAPLPSRRCRTAGPRR